MSLPSVFTGPIWTELTKNTCISAALHQGDVSFSDFSRGKQCLTNSVIFLCYTMNKIKTNYGIQSIDLNNILKQGDSLYLNVRDNGINTDYLLPSDLPTHVICSGKKNMLKITDIGIGNLLQLENDVNLFSTKSIEHAFDDAFKLSPTCLLCIKDSFVAIFKFDNFLLLFDSHSRDCHGFLTSEGTAVVIKFVFVSDLYIFLKQYSRYLTDSNEVRFELTSLNIEVIDIDSINGFSTKNSLSVYSKVNYAQLTPRESCYKNLKLKCHICGLQAKSLLAYVTHYSCHRHDANIYFPCVNNCNRNFKSYSSFKIHVKTAHNNQTVSTLAWSKFQDSEILFTCGITLCKQVCKGLIQFLIHLKTHSDSHDKIVCPFVKCNTVLNNRSSLASHWTRKHKNWDARHIKSIYLTFIPDIPDSVNNDNHAAILENYSPPELCPRESLNKGKSITLEDYVQCQAMFFLKLQVKHILPVSCIQSIADELEVANNYSTEYLLHTLSSATSSLPINVRDDVLKELINIEHKKKSSLHVLRSVKSRKTFYHKNMAYIKPVEFALGYDNNKKFRTAQYVSIKDLICMLYSRHSNNTGFWLKHSSTSGVFTDISSGSLMQSIAISSEKIIYLMLFQDSFEVTNPIGSGKKKHKTLAVYLTLANILSQKRYTSDQLQLVLMCRDVDFKFFGLKKVFAPLLSDLQEISMSGVAFSDTLTLTIKLLCILGDNLGSHAIGGFCENFSTAQYFCRYCLVTRIEFDTNPHFCGPERTKEIHNRSLLELANCGLNNFEGVKFQSPFNDISDFHVSTGLPPCLAHDCFEGLVSQDMYLFIKYFVTKRWFSYNNLNRRINLLKYLENDAQDKPCKVNKISCTKKLSGHAVQNWVFLRLFSIIIGSYVTNYEDSVWLLYLKLKQIMELVCSPKIDLAHIAYLKTLIHEYLSGRKELFPDNKLLPKHHYLCHYPQLILRYGPLIRVFTLRFESKHSYFKRCARNYHNYKHLCKTLTSTHQLLQAYNNSSITTQDYFSIDSFLFNGTNFNSLINSLILNTCGQFPHDVSTHVVFRGTHYKKNLFLLCDGIY
ncbi:uncharacterized protein LOC124810193 [Hydra vulgaris]|uniref:uncharacterized protein LOC124810193 n=1 Tax=Hydra vulgaris TaxID=6087 RepID=UPI001F5FC69A|nr:uncharacterized protein LOC124810193 [Hydra vulgaris]